MKLLISMPMFLEAPEFSINDVEKFAASSWIDLDSFSNKSSSEMTHSFDVSNAQVSIGVMRAAIPSSDLEGPCATSILWPDAMEEIQNHQSHLIVTIRSEVLSLIELSALLTKITAAVMAVSQQAIGVYWCNASLVIPKEIFVEFAIDVLPVENPVLMWVDFRVGTDESGNVSGFTQGLASLGLMELEATNATETVSELRERLTSIADYLMTHGMIIEDGDTLGDDEHALITVSYENSKFGHEGDVLNLNYVKKTAKKSLLKFW